MTIERPFRHLCPEADLRDAMTDDEFWAHVAKNLLGPDWDDEGDGPDPGDVHVAPTVCPTCGNQGACAYDAEGYPLIHAVEQDDDPDG